MQDNKKKTIKIEVTDNDNRMVSFDYIKDFVEELKEGISGRERKYYPEEKYWVIYGKRYDILLKRLAARFFDEAYWQYMENWETIMLDLKTMEKIKQKNLFEGNYLD